MAGMSRCGALLLWVFFREAEGGRVRGSGGMKGGKEGGRQGASVCVCERERERETVCVSW